MSKASILAACCALGLPLTVQQTPQPVQTPLTAFCHASQQDLRELPSQGFTRSILQPFNSTTANAAGTTAPAPIPAVAELANCRFQSFDADFDSIIGLNRTLYQVSRLVESADAASHQKIQSRALLRAPFI